MKLSEFDFYYNVPVDLENTIHFDSNEQRDSFFDSGVYGHSTYDPKRRFNFVRDRLTLNATLPTDMVNGLNYVRFRNEFDNDNYMYCFVERTEYINNNVTRLYLVADVVMTYLQGEWTNSIGKAYVKRMSATESEINKDKLFLLTNDDVLAFPKQYTHKDLEYWEDLDVVFTTSADLTSDFGTEKDPKLKTSVGSTHDALTSPVDVYVAQSEDKFKDFMKELSNYPWIAQNINDVFLVPKDILDEKDLEDFDAKNSFVKDNLKKFKNNSFTKSVDLEKLEVISSGHLKANFGLPRVPDFVLRHGYTNITLTNWQGQEVDIDPQYLNDYQMRVVAQSVFGYHNEIDVFVDRYKDGGENSVTGLYRGSYKDNAIIFKDFASIPVLIDNYKLGKANTAHQRELANQNTFTGRVNRVLDNNNDWQDRLMSAVSLTSNVTSLSGIGSGLSNDYEYYRRQQAQFQDMAIAAPTLQNQSTANGFAIGHFHFGVTAHYSAISFKDALKVVRYHALFGFDYQGTFQNLNPINDQSKIAFYSISGSYNVPNVPSQFLAQLKVQLNKGVRFYKFNGNPNVIKNTVPETEFMDEEAIND